MERYGSMMEEICDVENILFAWEKTRKRNGGAGVDGITVRQFAVAAQSHLMRLQEELLTGAYHPTPLLRFYVDKGDGERRALNIPCIYDRVAQQAVAAIITPVIDTAFEPCSYGYRKGKGRKQAIKEILRLRDIGHRYVVNADIEHCFDSIDHQILIQRLKDLIHDNSVVDLIAKWIMADILEGNRLETMMRGLPQGSVLSPVLSNLYLDLFDKVMMERGFSLIRYADDFVILEKQYAVAQQAVQTAQHLLGQLKLRLNAEKTEIVTFEQGFRYLGVLFTGDDILVTERDTLKLTSGSGRGKNEVYFHTPPDSPGMYSIETPSPFQGESETEPRLRDSEDILNSATPYINSPAPQAGHIPDSADMHFAGSATAVLDEISDTNVRSVAGEEPQNDWITQQFQTMQQLRTDVLGKKQELQAEPGEAVVKEKLNDTLSTSRLLSTLYIQEQGAVLSYSQKRFLVTKKKETILDVPAIKIEQILILGQCGITTPTISFCLKAGIPVCFASNHGSYYGRLASPTANQVMLQQKQFARNADPEFTLTLAKAFVSGKIHNQRSILQRRRRKAGTPELKTAISFLAEMLKKSQETNTLDELRGYEGTSSAKYFGIFSTLLDPGFSFTKRIKFPATDPVNAMLSFGYTLLFQNIHSLVEAHNLHPYCGYLHALRDGHPALVSDLMEEFRAFVVDSLVIYLINSHIIKPSDFEQKENAKRRCLLKPEARKTFVQQFENKMQTTITHPHTEYNVDYRRCIDLQIRELAQCIRGERENYRPMKVR